ncbi:hypothetical protein EJB05_22707, partial [Eragrostis curvula]
MVANPTALAQLHPHRLRALSKLAECERLLFDLPEAVEELVVGYQTQYSGVEMKFQETSYSAKRPDANFKGDEGTGTNIFSSD